MNKTVKTLMFWAVIVLSAFLLWQTVKSNPAEQSISEISYSRFLAQIADGQVSKVIIAGNVVRGWDTKGGAFRVIAPPNQTAMLEALQTRNVEVWFRETTEQGWPNWIMNLAPLVLLAALWFFMIRQMQSTSRRLAKQGSIASSSPPDSGPRFGP